jgi:hypothetical protein
MKTKFKKRLLACRPGDDNGRCKESEEEIKHSIKSQMSFGSSHSDFDTKNL